MNFVAAIYDSSQTLHLSLEKQAMKLEIDWKR